jgi:hypothetical protein
MVLHTNRALLIIDGTVQLILRVPIHWVCTVQRLITKVFECIVVVMRTSAGMFVSAHGANGKKRKRE